MSAPTGNLVLRHAWKLGFAVLALALLTARGATEGGPVQLHQRALQAVASDGPTNVPCGALPAGTTTWTAAHSPYILPLNTTNDPTQPSSACAAFPLPGQAQPNPLPGVIVQPGSTLVIDARLGPVQIFSHGAGITVNGGTLQTTNTGVVNGVLDSVTFDAEPDVASWDGIQILASDSAHRGNASLGYTSIGHALTSITITSGATSTANPSGQAGTVPYGLALYKSAIGPSYFDGIDVTDTPISFKGELAATSPPVTQPQLADGLFGTINNIGSQGINLTYDAAAPANSAGVDIEAAAFGSSVPFGDTTCPALSGCAAGTIGNNAIEATFAQAPAVPVTLIDNRFYRAGSYGVDLTNANGPQITNNLFDCNGSGTPKPLVTPCTGNGLKYSAIYLNNATVDLENKVTGNSGQEDGLDAIVFSGTVTSPTFTWKNATNDLNNQHPLGYLIDGGMSMNGGTFNVPGGSIVKVKDGAINLTNTRLDASDSGAKVFTSLRDNANITSCPSVFVQSCPSPLPSGEWTGIDVGSQASANLNNVSILYPTTGVMAHGAKGVTITQSIAGASNIGPTFADGITAVNTPLSVSNTSFVCPANVCTGAAIGDQGISADYTSAGGTLAGALTVTGNTFQSSVNEAVIATGLAGQPVDIESNGISSAGGFGINLQGADHLTLKNNTITNSGLASPTHSAIYLNGVTNADFGNLISGNTGTGNGLNAIVFHGSTATPLGWQTVGLANATSANPLGYMLDGDLGVAGNLTLATTDPRGDYVPVMNGGKITVSGALTGSNSTFTSFKEHSRIPTCGSVFVPKVSGACQAAAAGDWGGLVLASNQANSLTGGEIRYATTGISIGNPGVALTADNLTLTNTNIRNTVFDGLHSQSPVTVSGGTFSNNGASAITVDLTSGGVVTGRNLDIEGASISGSGSDGIVGINLTGQPATIRGVAVDHSGGYGIDLKGADNLTLKDNLVTNAAKNFAAIYLNGYSGDFANNVTGNKGARNGLDALVFHGTVTGNLTWQTARKTSDPTRLLGYLLDNSLSMPNAGTTLTVNAGDIVKVGNGGTLLLEGVTLRADNTGTSAQKIFTSLTDNSAGVAACPSQLLPTCTAPAPGDWGGINLSGSTANGSLVNAAIRYAGTGIDISNGAASTPTSSSFGLVVSRSSISSSQGDALDALNTSMSVTDSTITGAVHGISTNVVGSGVTAYLRLSGNRFMSTSAEAILGQALAGQPVWITDNHIQDAAPFGIRLVGANALVLRNNNVSCSGLGNETCAASTDPPYPAIYLDGVSADFANNVRGNVGAKNGMDVLAFHGDVNGDLNWLTPTVNVTTERLGYLLNGAVRVNDGTLKVHAGDVVKSLGGPITIRGGVLDASDPAAGTKLFTSLKDMSAYPATCPSVFTGLCSGLAAQPGDWGGLVITSDAAGNSGTGSITRGLVNYAETAVSIDSGPSNTVAPDLTVTSSTVLNASKDAINAFDSPIDVEHSFIGDPSSVGLLAGTPNIGAHGIIASFFSPSNCTACDRLKVIGNSVIGTAKDGIVANGLGGQGVDIESNTVTSAGTYGVRLVDANALTLTDNTVNASGGPSSGFRYPAIYLSNVSADFEVASALGTVAGNHGTGNGIDAIAMHGKTTNPLIWLTTGVPYGALPADHFGYLLDGDLSVAGQLKTNAGDSVKVLNGALSVSSLDATGTNFTSLKDGSLGVPACGLAYDSVFIQRLPGTCPNPASGDWKGIAVSGITTITGSTIAYDDGLSVSNGSLVFTEGAMHDIKANAISLTNSPSSISGVTFTNIGGLAVTTSGAAVSVRCDQILAGGISGDSGLTVGQSDLLAFYNSHSVPDVTATSGTVSAQFDFWGPPDPAAPNTAPPASGQTSGTVDASHYLATQRPTLDSSLDPKVSLTVVDAPLAANEPLGSPVQPLDPNQVDASNNHVSDATGLLTVTAVYGRQMDTTLNPTIHFALPVQPVLVLLPGDGWQSDNQTFIAHFRLDSLVGSVGLTAASVTLSDARACVKADIMTPKTLNFNVDVNSFATSVINLPGDAPTRIGAHSALLHGEITTNGYAITDNSTVFAHFVVTPLPLGSGPSISAPIRETVPKNAAANYPVTGLAIGLSPLTQYSYSLVVSSPNNVATGGFDSGPAASDFMTTDEAKTLVFAPIAPPIVAGTPFSVTVSAFDAEGTPQLVQDYTGTVTLGVTVADSAATLPAEQFSTGDTGDNGIHTFQSVTLTKAVLQTLTATGTGPLSPSGDSASFTVKPGPLDHFTVAAIPDQTAGSSFAVTATAKDVFENVKDDYTGGASVAGSTGAAPGSSTAGCSGPCPPNYDAFGTWTGGVATANVTLYKAESARSLTVADGTHTGTSNTFTIGPATPDQISFSQQPGGSPTGGIAFPVQPKVLSQDLYGNNVSGTSVALTITPLTGTSGAMLSCPSETGNALNTDSTGTASFSDCAIDKAGTGYKLQAAAGSLTVDSNTFDVVVGPPKTVSFSQEPAGPATGGSALTSQPQVTVTDAGGNAVSATNVVLSIASGTGALGATLTCDQAIDTQATDSNGLAAFTGCKIDKAATGYKLHAVAQTASADSSPAFDVTVGAATSLTFGQQPGGASTGGVAFPTQPHLLLTDAGGNGVSGTSVALTITPLTGTSGAMLSCPSETGNALNTDTTGTASFSDCAIDKAGTGYKLHAAAGSLTVDSNTFDVVVGPATGLTFHTEPAGASHGAAFTTQPEVWEVDAGGNAIASDNVTQITLTITTGTGATGAMLTCTADPLTVTGGKAAFSGCQIDLASPPDYQLNAAGGGFAKDSAAFTVS